MDLNKSMQWMPFPMVEDFVLQQNITTKIDFEKLVNKYTDNINKNSNEEELYIGRGYVYLKYLKQYELASSDFSEAIKISESNPDYYFYRCYSYFLNGDCENGYNDLKKIIYYNCLNDFERYIYTRKLEEDFMLDLPKRAVINKDEKELLRVLGAIIYNHFLDKGKDYENEGEYQKSMMFYKIAIGYYPYLAMGYYLMGDLNRKNNKYNEALLYLNKAISISNNYEDAIYCRALIYMKINYYENALNDFNKCIELVPNFPYAYFNRGTLLYKIGKFNESKSDFKKYLETLHDYEYFYGICADIEKIDKVKIYLNDIENEIIKQELVNKNVHGIEIDTNNDKYLRKISIGLCNFGIAEKRKGNYEIALRYYAEAKVIDSTNPDIYYNTCKILIGLGNYDLAFKNLMTYLHINRAIANTSAFSSVIFMTEIWFSFLKMYIWHGEILPGFSLTTEQYNNMVFNMAHFYSMVMDSNACFLAGLCYILNDKSILDFHKIEEYLIDDIISGLLGKPSQVLLKSDEKFFLINTVGLFYVIINYIIFKNNPEEISEIYFYENFTIEKDITLITKYLKNYEEFEENEQDNEMDENIF